MTLADRFLPGIKPVLPTAPEFQRRVYDYTQLNALGQSNRSCFRVYAEADQSITANVETVVEFTKREWDFGRIQANGTPETFGSFDLSTNTLRATVYGVYDLRYNFTVTATTTSQVEYRIYRNNTLFVSDYRTSVANQKQTASFVRHLYLEEGDEVQVRAFPAANITIDADRDWTGLMIQR